MGNIRPFRGVRDFGEANINMYTSVPPNILKNDVETKLHVLHVSNLFVLLVGLTIRSRGISVHTCTICDWSKQSCLITKTIIIT